MQFWVISVLPDLFAPFAMQGIVGRTIVEKRVSLTIINPRNFALGNYRKIDDRPFGGGPGMVMMAEPLERAILTAKDQAKEQGCQNCPVIYLSPQGHTLCETAVQDCLLYDGMILLCGRYEGIDERLIEQYVDAEISIGDYVLTGGELPAMVLMDSVIRRLPNVMGDDRSANEDSFVDGLLDCPHYTKPLSFHNKNVPQVLLTGHHNNIAKWRFMAQLERTRQRRVDLYQAFLVNADTNLDKKHKKWLVEFLGQTTN